MTTDTTLAITVDVEFFDSPFLFRDRAPDRIPNEARTMGIEGLKFIANLLERHGARGTFFTLGEVAQQVPETIADLTKRGHEIASHGYSKSHPDLRERSRGTVREELDKSKRAIENVTDEPVEGFRAPAFAINDEVLEVVHDVGYTYDSSVVPGRHIPGFYGTPNAPQNPFHSDRWFSTPGVFEFPTATAPYFRLPISGAWMRLLGRRYVLWGVRNHMKRHSVTVLYVHPWELVDVPQYDPIPRRVAWRTGPYTRKILQTLVRKHAPHIRTVGSLQNNFDILDRK